MTLETLTLSAVTVTKNHPSQPDALKDSSNFVPILVPHMISSVSSTYASYANQVSQPAARQPQPQQRGSLPQDTVTLKSTGDVDHDGDSH